MGKKYIIEDGLVRSIDTQQVGERTVTTELDPVHLDVFIDQLAIRANHRVFFPPISFGHVIAEAKQNRKAVYIIQQNPSVVRITEKIDPPQMMEHERKIGVPYVYFAVTLDGNEFQHMKVYFRRQQVTSEDDMLGFCPLPNQDEHSLVCVSRSLSDDLRGLRTPADILDAVINSFWNSPFNNDWRTNWDNARRRIRNFPDTFEEWANITADRNRQRQVLVWDWLPANVTIGSLLSEVRR